MYFGEMIGWGSHEKSIEMSNCFDGYSAGSNGII